jgi:hypothetical protein
MNYRVTILNISAAVFLAGILIYTIWNYKILSAEEGWGIVAMVGLTGIGIMAGLTDLILQQFVKNRTLMNVIGLIIVIGLAIAILIG